jgi:hypothetical protein
MKVLTDPAAMRSWLPQLRGAPEFLVSGEGSPGPGRDWTISLWLRRSTNLNVCVLCVRDEWLENDDGEREANLGEPTPCLMYLYPTSRCVDTIAQWLIREYLEIGGRAIDSVDEQGAVDLSAFFEDWIKED